MTDLISDEDQKKEEWSEVEDNIFEHACAEVDQDPFTFDVLVGNEKSFDNAATADRNTTGLQQVLTRPLSENSRSTVHLPDPMAFLNALEVDHINSYRLPRSYSSISPGGTAALQNDRGDWPEFHPIQHQYLQSLTFESFRESVPRYDTSLQHMVQEPYQIPAQSSMRLPLRRRDTSLHREMDILHNRNGFAPEPNNEDDVNDESTFLLANYNSQTQSYDTQLLPSVPEELRLKVDMPVASVATHVRRGDFKSVQVQFNSVEAYDKAQNNIRSLIPINSDDKTYPVSGNAEMDYVKQIIHAMNNISGAHDNQGMIDKWNKLKKNTSIVEEAAWRVLVSLRDNDNEMNFALGGIRLTFLSLKKLTKESHSQNEALIPGARPSKRYVTFEEHIDDLCRTLKEEKTICKHLLAVDYARCLVDDPITSAHRVENNRRVNKGKKESMERGRAALSKAKTDELSDELDDESLYPTLEPAHTQSSSGPMHQISQPNQHLLNQAINYGSESVPGHLLGSAVPHQTPEPASESLQPLLLSVKNSSSKPVRKKNSTNRTNTASPVPVSKRKRKMEDDGEASYQPTARRKSRTRVSKYGLLPGPNGSVIVDEAPSSPMVPSTLTVKEEPKADATGQGFVVYQTGLPVSETVSSPWNLPLVDLNWDQRPLSESPHRMFQSSTSSYEPGQYTGSLRYHTNRLAIAAQMVPHHLERLQINTAQEVAIDPALERAEYHEAVSDF